MSIISSLGATGAAPSTQSTASKAGTLDKDGFLKLLTAQLHGQDPMSAAQDPSQSVQQMTQFSILEQLTNLASTSAKGTAATSLSGAVALLGRTVSYIGGDGAHTGVVEHVDVANGAPTLTVSGASGVDPTTITEVR